MASYSGHSSVSLPEGICLFPDVSIFWGHATKCPKNKTVESLEQGPEGGKFIMETHRQICF